MYFARMLTCLDDWTGLDWTGLDWTGLDWTGLDRTGPDWTGLDRTGPDWTGLDWTGQTFPTVPLNRNRLRLVFPHRPVVIVVVDGGRGEQYNLSAVSVEDCDVCDDVSFMPLCFIDEEVGVPACPFGEHVFFFILIFSVIISFTFQPDS